MRFSALIATLPSLAHNASHDASQNACHNASMDLAGDPWIESAAPMHEAGQGQICFYESGSGDTIHSGTSPAAVILPVGNESLKASASSLGIAWVESASPKLSFAELLDVLHPEEPIEPGIDSSARIHPTAELGADVAIGALVVIGAHCRIGDRCRIHPGAILQHHVAIASDCEIHSGVVLHRHTSIGRHCVIQANAVVGAEGFGFVRTPHGLRKMPQTGRVVLEDHVELGCNSCVDRPAMGETRIGRGTKIDNLVQIGHGVQIGCDCALASQVGIAGAAQLGNGVILGGQVGVADKISLGDGVVAYAKAAIPGNVASGEVVCGVPAIPARQFVRSAAVFKSLPEMARSLRQLEKQHSEEADAADP